MRQLIVAACCALACGCEPPALVIPEPVVIDSDGDSYSDDDEAFERTDPNDYESRIYTGFWPYQRDKGRIPDPGFGAPAAVGGEVPRFALVDQFGETVDIYDYAGQDRLIVLEMSGAWCSWCHELSAWLDGAPSAYDEHEQFRPIREKVRTGEVLWVTLLATDESADPADEEDVRRWFEAHPHERVAVLADTDQTVAEHLAGSAWPRLALVDPQMRYLVVDDGVGGVFAALLDPTVQP